MQKLMDRRYPVTNILLLVTTLVFLAMQMLRFGQATSARTIYDFGGLYGEVVKLDPSQFWRLVSPIFVHIGWEHFFFNSLTLYVFGYQLEALYGSKGFAILYFLSGIMGNVFVLFLTPDAVAAGASTSLFGLFGAMVVLRYRSRNTYLQMVGQRYVTLLVLNLVLGFFNPEISLAGHIGGVVGGCLVGVFLPTLVEPNLFGKQQRYLALLLYAGLALALVGLSFLS